MGQINYLNNIVEQDHQAYQTHRATHIGFKTIRCARAVIADIADIADIGTMHTIRKDQLIDSEGRASSPACQPLAGFLSGGKLSGLSSLASLLRQDQNDFTGDVSKYETKPMIERFFGCSATNICGCV